MNQAIIEMYDELKMRLFYILAFTAIIANTIGFISNAVIYGFTNITIFTLVCDLIMILLGIQGFYFQKYYLPATIILLFGNFIEFPILYIAYGSYYILYMVLGIITTVLFLENKGRFIGPAVITLFDGILIFARVNYSYLFKSIEQPVSLPGILVTYCITMISMITMTVVLMNYYVRQQDKLTELTKELQNMANLDPLTYLYNRRYLVNYINQKMKDKEHEFSIALLDIDDFKMINDHYGHIFGDETLQKFANILLKHMQGKGIATRFGGEEFMLVFHSFDKEEIEKTLDNISKDFKQFGLDSKGIAFSFSGGVETYYHEDEIVKLFNNADHKLYDAKHHGKNKVIFGE